MTELSNIENTGSCEVLLATFNSEKWLRPMLSSLANQSHKNFKLIVGDDGSSDATFAILEEYAEAFEGPVEIYRNNPPARSALGNFNALVERSQADYVLFADHDDIWAPEKIAVSLNKLRTIEEAHSSAIPAYAFADAFVIDADGRQLAQSFWDFKRINPDLVKSLSHSLVCSGVLGCASAINRAALELAFPVPAPMPGHDWWAALVVNIFGVIEPIPEKLLRYRIHASNSSRPRGANPTKLAATPDKREVVRYGLARRTQQARALLDTFGDSIHGEKRSTLERFAEIQDLGPFDRRLRVVTGRYLYPDAYRNIATLIWM